MGWGYGRHVPSLLLVALRQLHLHAINAVHTIDEQDQNEDKSNLHPILQFCYEGAFATVWLLVTAHIRPLSWMCSVSPLQVHLVSEEKELGWLYIHESKHSAPNRKRQRDDEEHEQSHLRNKQQEHL